MFFDAYNGLLFQSRFDSLDESELGIHMPRNDPRNVLTAVTQALMLMSRVDIGEDQTLCHTPATMTRPPGIPRLQRAHPLTTIVPFYGRSPGKLKSDHKHDTVSASQVPRIFLRLNILFQIFLHRQKGRKWLSKGIYKFCFGLIFCRCYFVTFCKVLIHIYG